MFKFFSQKFDDLKNAVSNTAKNLVTNVVDTVVDEPEFSDFILDDMEDMLISADLGVMYAAELVDALRNQSTVRPSQVKSYLKTEFLKTLACAGSSELNLYAKNNIVINTCEFHIKQKINRSTTDKDLRDKLCKIKWINFKDRVNRFCRFSRKGTFRYAYSP